MNQQYICEIRLNGQIDRRSYLADLPVKTGTMLLGRVLSAGLGAAFAWGLGSLFL